MSNREMQNLLTLAAIQLERSANGYEAMLRVRHDLEGRDLAEMRQVIQEDRDTAAKLKEAAATGGNSHGV